MTTFNQFSLLVKNNLTNIDIMNDMHIARQISRSKYHNKKYLLVPDIWAPILSFADFSDLVNLSRTCTIYRKMCKELPLQVFYTILSEEPYDLQTLLCNSFTHAIAQLPLQQMSYHWYESSWREKGVVQGILSSIESNDFDAITILSKLYTCPQFEMTVQDIRDIGDRRNNWDALDTFLSFFTTRADSETLSQIYAQVSYEYQSDMVLFEGKKCEQMMPYENWYPCTNAFATDIHINNPLFILGYLFGSQEMMNHIINLFKIENTNLGDNVYKHDIFDKYGNFFEFAEYIEANAGWPSFSSRIEFFEYSKPFELSESPIYVETIEISLD